MAALLGLSNELLFKIIDQIHPNDLPKFSLICKDIYRVAKDAVETHLDRVDTYENLVLHGCHRHQANAHPLPLIKEMCMDWRIGEYVKTLTVECCGPPRDPARFPEEEDIEDTQKYTLEKKEDNLVNRSIMPAILDYVKEKADEWCIPPPNCFEIESLCKEGEEGDRSAMIALLLLLFLPNLEAIRFSQFTWGALYLKRTIISMSERDPQQGLRARKPFSNLKQVDIRGSRRSSRGKDFNVFIWFAALPSMRTLRGDVIGDHRQPFERCTIPPHTSNVTEISISNSAIHPVNLEQLLLRINSLERFTYGHNESMAGGQGLKVYTILNMLFDHAKHSLKFLALYGERCAFDWAAYRAHFHGFGALEELRLNTWLFVSFRVASDRLRIREDVQPLVYALPLSIERITFFAVDDFSHVTALFFDFTEKKPSRLPRLNNIKIEGYCSEANDEDWAQLREMCRKLGVTLEIHGG